MRALVGKMVPMADGVHLATDAWLPDGPGPFPVILVRTPYHRKGGGPQHYVRRGYAVVVQDCRGKFDSEGLFTPLVDEARDGTDTVAWVAEQEWCNGRIGMTGGSYLGFVQVPAASGGHEALRCIVPQVTSSSYFRHWARYDGCPALSNALMWNLSNAVLRTKTTISHIRWDDLYRLSALEEIFELVGFECETLRQWMTHDRYDEYWESIDQFPMHEKIKVPGCHIGGWFDHHLQGQCETYQRIRDLGANAAARSGQRLILGPWRHSTFNATGEAHRRCGDWDFSAAADVRISNFEQRFLDLHLKDKDDGLSEEAPVHVFLMGANRWIDLQDWPPPGARVEKLYLRSNGHADTRNGPGRLEWESPGNEPPDRYDYDPRDPMPTLGGQVYQGIEEGGARDQRPIFERTDFAYYRSYALADDLAVVGNVELDLWVASSAEDADFVARMGVLERNGAVTCFTYGSLRCRYRKNWSEPLPLEPGTPTLIHIQMGHTAYVFPKGSRIVLLVTSSCFPRIVPNSSTMAPPFSGTRPETARQQLFHDLQHSSCLQLPLVDGV